MEKNDNISLIFGIIALVLEFISIFVCGWLSIIGLGLGIGGTCMPTSSTGKKIPAIVAIPAGVILGIVWIIALAALLGR